MALVSLTVHKYGDGALMCWGLGLAWPTAIERLSSSASRNPMTEQKLRELCSQILLENDPVKRSALVEELQRIAGEFPQNPFPSKPISPN